MGSIFQALDRATILSMIMISALISILTLSIPLAAQTLINLIAFGGLIQPVVFLSIIVFVIMMVLCVLYVWQEIIVEVVQQKLMVKITLSLTHQFTHISLDSFSSHYGPEIVNHFFEIVTVKKSIASLLLYGVNLGLQVFLGLLLLIFYHPLFLVFDGFIITGLMLTIFLPYTKGLETAKDECSRKHEIGAWLEELLINRVLFRLNSNHIYATQQSDKRLVSFLKGRNRHFKQLLKHQIGFYILSALAGSILLGLGGYLVINNQLSLGQLVAAEMVLGALIYAFKRFGALLEEYYDLQASNGKLEIVLGLSRNEDKQEIKMLFTPMISIGIKIPSQHEVVALHKNPLVIYSYLAEHCQNFVDAFFGFKHHISFDLYVNNNVLSYDNRGLIRHCSLLIGRPQWFAGTIYDNLLLHQSKVSETFILDLLRKVGLLDKVMCQPKALKTIIYEWHTIFTDFELLQLMVVRALIVKPQLIIIDRAFDLLDENYDMLISELLGLENTILIFVTQQNDFNGIKNQLVLP